MFNHITKMLATTEIITICKCSFHIHESSQLQNKSMPIFKIQTNEQKKKNFFCLSFVGCIYILFYFNCELFQCKTLIVVKITWTYKHYNVDIFFCTLWIKIINELKHAKISLSLFSFFFSLSLWFHTDCSNIRRINT